METQVMGLTPLHQGAWHSTCPQPFPKPPVGAGGQTLVLFVTQPNRHLQSLPGSCGQELGPWEMVSSSQPVPSRAAAAPAAPTSQVMGMGFTARVTNQARHDKEFFYDEDGKTLA